MSQESRSKPETMSETQQQESAVESCLKLLSGQSDESMFAGLLLLTKHVKTEGFAKHRRRVFNAMHGKNFLLRLLVSNNKDHGEQYQALSISLLAFFAQDETFAKLKLSEFIPHVVQVLCRYVQRVSSKSSGSPTENENNFVKDALQVLWALCVPHVHSTQLGGSGINQQNSDNKMQGEGNIESNYAFQSGNASKSNSLTCLNGQVVPLLVAISCSETINDGIGAMNDEAANWQSLQVEICRRVQMENPYMTMVCPPETRIIALRLLLVIFQQQRLFTVKKLSVIGATAVALTLAREPTEHTQIISLLESVMEENHDRLMIEACENENVSGMSSHLLLSHALCYTVSTLLGSKGVNQALRTSSLMLAVQVGQHCGSAWIVSKYMRLKLSSRTKNVANLQEKFVVMLHKLISVEFAVRFTELSLAFQTKDSTQSMENGEQGRLFNQAANALIACATLIDQSVENLVGPEDGNSTKQYWDTILSTDTILSVAVSLQDIFTNIVGLLSLSSDVLKLSWLTGSTSEVEESSERFFRNLGAQQRGDLAALLVCLANTLARWMIDDIDTSSKGPRRDAVELLPWMMTLPDPSSFYSNATSVAEVSCGVDFQLIWPVLELECKRSKKLCRQIAASPLALVRLSAYTIDLLNQLREQITAADPHSAVDIDKLNAHVFRIIDIGDIYCVMESVWNVEDQEHVRNLEHQSSVLKKGGSLLISIIRAFDDMSKADFPLGTFDEEESYSFAFFQGFLWHAIGSTCNMWLGQIAQCCEEVEQACKLYLKLDSRVPTSYANEMKTLIPGRIRDGLSRIISNRCEADVTNP